jgi:hypothetical protein
VTAALLALAIAVLSFVLVAMRVRAGGGFAAVRAAWTGEPCCPSCRIAMVPLVSRPFPPRAYRVWVCLRCTNALATSTAGDTEAPECSSCHQRSLLVPIWRLPASPSGEPQVQVHEACPVCGHHAVEELPDVEREPPLAEVIPFPKPRQVSE